MTRISGSVLAIGVLLLGAGCSTLRCGVDKAQFLNSYDEFIADVHAMDMRITDAKWRLYDDRLETFVTECYPSFEEDMSFRERQTFLSSAIKYYYKRYGSHMIQELQDENNPTSEVIKESMAEIWENPNEIFREITGEDWDQLVDDFLNDLEKWKTRLQEILEEN